MQFRTLFHRQSQARLDQFSLVKMAIERVKLVQSITNNTNSPLRLHSYCSV